MSVLVSNDVFGVHEKGETYMASFGLFLFPPNVHWWLLSSWNQVHGDSTPYKTTWGQCIFGANVFSWQSVRAEKLLDNCSKCTSNHWDKKNVEFCEGVLKFHVCWAINKKIVEPKFTLLLSYTEDEFNTVVLSENDISVSVNFFWRYFTWDSPLNRFFLVRLLPRWTFH